MNKDILESIMRDYELDVAITDNLFLRIEESEYLTQVIHEKAKDITIDPINKIINTKYISMEYDFLKGKHAEDSVFVIVRDKGWTPYCIGMFSWCEEHTGEKKTHLEKTLMGSGEKIEYIFENYCKKCPRCRK